MALWKAKTRRDTIPEEMSTPNVSSHEEDVVSDMYDEGNMSMEYFRPTSSILRYGAGDDTEDAEVTLYRKTPEELRQEVFNRIKDNIAYGRAPGGKGQVVRVRTRNSPSYHNAPLHGGDVKPRLITEEKLIELGFVNSAGQPFNPAGLRRNVVVPRCTCLASI